MSDLLNGVGILVALSALPMFGGVLLREGNAAKWLRRIAIVLAIALPALFMLVIALVYLRQSDTTFFDFSVNYDASLNLYQRGISPYTNPTVFSIPFPTFYLYWLASLLGNVDKASTWVIWWIVNATLWFCCAFVLWRVIVTSGSSRTRDILRYTAVAIPGAITIWQGQTALLILSGLVVLYLIVQKKAEPTVLSILLAGGGLAWATLIKPQLAIVGVGIALWALFQVLRGQREKAKFPLLILIASVAISGLLVGAALLLPGGVSLDTYRQFFSQVLPVIAKPGDPLPVIGSPAFALASLVVQLGGSATSGDLVADAVTVLMLGAATLWTFRRAERPLTEIVAGWGVWAMVSPRLTWTWYATWCLPFFFLAVLETSRGQNSRSTKSRLFLFTMVLFLLNMQVAQALVSFATIVLLIALLWTSFKPEGQVSRV